MYRAQTLKATLSLPSETWSTAGKASSDHRIQRRWCSLLGRFAPSSRGLCCNRWAHSSRSLFLVYFTLSRHFLFRGPSSVSTTNLCALLRLVASVDCMTKFHMHNMFCNEILSFHRPLPTHAHTLSRTCTTCTKVTVTRRDFYPISKRSDLWNQMSRTKTIAWYEKMVNQHPWVRWYIGMYSA